MRFRFNNDIITTQPGEIQTPVVEWFRNVFAMIADDDNWIHPDAGQVWRKVGNLNRCFVLTNPDSTFRTTDAKAAVIRNAYHLATAFPGAEVYCPFSNQIANTITQAVVPATVRVHFKVVCLRK